MKTKILFDLSSRMFDYENGNLDSGEAIDLFQDLITTGMAWQLQGHYGRTAKALIDRGFCHLPVN